MSVPQHASAAEDPEAALLEHFGHAGFRDGQRAVVDALLEGASVLAVMPTGAGKSLCFQLPALLRPGFAVVVSPLIALMQNQVDALKAAGVAAGMIHSGRPREDNVADWRAAASGQLKLLYMSPERLFTHRMSSALSRLPVSMFVIDEAHCISQWGHQFRQEYLALARLRQAFPDVPIAAFTATADAATREDIVRRLFGGDAKTFVHGFDRPNISIDVRKRGEAGRQVAGIVRQRRGQNGIIYCRSRKTTEKTAELLREQGVSAFSYHAGLEDHIRAERLQMFLMRSDVVICATIAFGMGVDKPNVRYVIHRDLPGGLEAYYQEIGRAGRDGAPAEAILLYSRGDLMARRKMIDAGDAPEDIKRAERGRLDRLVSICETTQCRRQILLAEFGDPTPHRCGNCDRCTAG